MPLLLVDIQYLPYLQIEIAVTLRQPLLQIFMYSGLGYAEMSGGGSDCSAGFDHVHSQAASALLDGVCHSIPSDCCVLLEKHMQAGGEICILDMVGQTS